MSTFSTLPIAQAWLANLEQLGYLEMTPIQALALPAMLEGRDVLGQAATGTGKTAAFGLALLARITPRSDRPGALVLCPTRELAAQVAEEIRRLARPLPHTRVLTLSGGTSVQRERASLEHGVDVIVGTPGRVHDHILRDRLDLSGIRTLVLDEADQMLEMGFVETVGAIARAVPGEHQTLLFSATFSDEVRALSTTYQKRDAYHVSVPVEDIASRITQVVYRVERTERVSALIRILGHHCPESAIVFCNHRETCDEVAAALAKSGFAAVALHGGMEQHDRNTVLLLLRNGSLRVVVATDVAARGLDIDDLGAIVNFDLPREPDVFVHRIGRTARAGRSGLAISLGLASDERILEELRREGPLAGATITDVPSAEAQLPPPPAMVTIAIQGGRHDRLRPGDIVGALTTGVGIVAADIGQIALNDRISFVAVVASEAKRALDGLAAGRIKNKRFRAYLVKPPR